jgi:uncharacterized protein (TIGR02246 family)
MRKALALVALALVRGMSLEAEGQSDAKAVEQAVRDFYKQAVAAELAGDSEAFVAVFAPDWRVTSNGLTLTRDQVGEFFKIRKWTRDDITNIVVRLVSPDTAVSTAISESAGTDDGQPFEQTDYLTDVFVRRDGKWVCVASHWSTALR